MGVYDEVFFSSPDEAFKTNASSHDGKVLLPFISCWRLPEFSINRTTYNDMRVRKGHEIRTPNISSRNVRGVPVTLTYQIDIYSNKRLTCDGIAAELLLQLLENPFLNADIPDIGIQQFELVISDNVGDNTSISEFEDTGRIYRLTIEAILNDAIIYRIDKYDTKLVEKILVDIGDLNTGNILETYIDEGIVE